MADTPRNPPFDSPLGRQLEADFMTRLRRMLELAERNAPPVVLMSELSMLINNAMIAYPESYAQMVIFPQLELQKFRNGWCRANGCGEYAQEDGLCPKHSREDEESYNICNVEVNIIFFNRLGKELKAYLWSKGYNSVDKIMDLYRDDPAALKKMLDESGIKDAYTTVEEHTRSLLGEE